MMSQLPNPKKDTTGGVKYCRHKGKTTDVFAIFVPFNKLEGIPVASQSVAFAMAPNKT
jgi:hypothetical protein